MDKQGDNGLLPADILGDVARALPLLKDALSVRYLEAVTPALLRVDRFWDPLRNDPRLQRLIADKEE